MNTFAIPHVAISKTRKVELTEIMVAGNTALRQLHERVKLTQGARYSRQQFRIDLFKKLGSAHAPAEAVNLHGILLPKRSIALIQAVRKVQDEIIAGYTRLVIQRIVKWHRSVPTELDRDDLYQEAVMALIEAVFGYNNPSVKFITYASHAIYRKLIKETLRYRQTGHLTNNGQKLIVDFEKARKQFNGPTSFDQVCDKMGLDEEQRGILSSILARVVRISEMSDAVDSEESSSFEPTDHRTTEHLDYDQIAAVERVRERLNEWQSDVLDGFLSGHRGWQAEVARKHGKSRMGPSKAMDTIKRLIEEEYAETIEDEELVAA